MDAVLAAFIAGLLGGVHCVGMCGGIAGALGGAAQRAPAIRLVPVATLNSPARGQTLRRLLAFNAGRIGSYAVAGGVAGMLGSVVTLAGPVEVGRAAAFIAAQTMLVLLGLYIAGWSAFFPRLEAAGSRVWRTIEPLRRRVMPVDSAAKAVAAGAVWGWVPCGLVYGMLPLALTGGSALNGALILIAFGAGTLPWLLAAGSLGSRLVRFRQSRAVRGVMGSLLIMLAVTSVLLLMHRH
jgi:sulfite exporter TauE/SafE